MIFIVGAVATLVTVAPLFLGADRFPTVAYLVSMLMGVGFAVATAGVIRSVVAQRRSIRRATEPDPSTGDGSSARCGGPLPATGTDTGRDRQRTGSA